MPTKTSKSPPPDVIDKLVPLLVSNLTTGQINAAAEKLGLLSQDLPSALALVKRRITIAADYDRDQQVGTAFVRLNDIYRRSLTVQDVKTALAAQKELNKLLSLYAAIPIDVQTAEPKVGDEETEGAMEHLSSLGLAPEGTGLSELCRLAVARILKLESVEN